MPVYDFSGGINALNDGIRSLGDSLQLANRQTQSTAVANALASGNWDSAMQAAAAAGDINTVLKLRELKQSADQANAFNSQLPAAIKALYPGTGAGATGTPLATTGTGSASADQVSRAILGQESGGNPNVRDSPDGAKGIGQIMPATFAQYAKPGEIITNPTDNYNVHQRIIQDYAQRYNNDPQRIAVAYFSGPGNVASPESPTPWIRNSRDGGGQSVAGYVSGIMSRLGGNRSATGTPSALLGGGAGETQPVVRAADGTTYSGPNAAAAAAADIPSPGAAPVSGAYPQLVDDAPLPPVRPAGLGDSLAPPQQPADPALAQFLASHVGGPDVASRLLQAPPNTPTGSIVPPGLLPHDDAIKPAGQFIAEAKQALAGGMAHGTPQTLAPPAGMPPPPVNPVPGLAASDAMGAPVIPPVTPAPVVPPQAPPDPYAGLNPVRASYYRSRGLGPDGQPLAAPVQAGVPASAPSAPSVVPSPSAPVPAAAPADIAAIERTMPAVQQQAASVGGGQVNDAGMAAASALTSGQPVPQGLGASLQAPVMQALTQGGAPAALAQGPPPQAAPPPSVAALPPSVAVDASGSTPPAEAPGATAATPPAPPAAPAPAPAIEVPGYEGKYTRAQSDDSEGNPSQAEWDAAAKEQGIGAAPAPPIDAKLPPTPAAVKAGDPTVTAAAPVSPQVARSLAQTRPGSDQRMMLFALLMRAAANSGPQSAGNVKFVEGLMAIEKQHQEDWGKTERIVSPAELAQIGFTPPPGAIVQADPWGNLKVTQGAKPPGHIMTPAEVKAAGLDPATGTGRVWFNPGDGSEPKSLDAPDPGETYTPIEPGSDQAKAYPGAVATITGGKNTGKPIYPPTQMIEPKEKQIFAEIHGNIVKEAAARAVPAQDAINALDTMQAAIDAGKGHITYGPWAEQVLHAKQALEGTFGIKMEGTSASEILNKMNTQVASAQSRLLTSRPALQEFVNFMRTTPGLATSEKGNILLIKVMREEASHRLALAGIAERSTGWDDYLAKRDAYESKYQKTNPFTGQPLGAPTAPAAPITAAPMTPGAAPGPGGYVWHPDGSLTPKGANP